MNPNEMKVVTEVPLTPEEEATVALRKLQMIKEAKMQEVKNQIQKLLDDNNLELSIQQTIHVVPKK